MTSASHALSPLALQAAARGLRTLALGQATTLRPARDGVLRVQRGARWVTQGDSASTGCRAGDEFLWPWQRLSLRAGDAVVVEPIAVPGSPVQRVALEWQPSPATRWSADVARPAHELRRALHDAAQAGVRLARGLLRWALHRPPSCGEMG